MSPDAIDEIRELHRQRQDLLSARNRLLLQIKSICRRCCDGNKAEGRLLYAAIRGGAAHPMEAMATVFLLPLLASMEPIEAQLKPVEKALVKSAEKLPVYASFVAGVTGFGALGLGQIVGEAGNLDNYDNPARLWKRFGLGLVGAERQRKCKDKAMAKLMGYNPRRRSVMFVVGDSLLKKQNPYRDLYLERKAYEVEKAPDLSKIAHHRRAQRYVEKRLLRDLWRAWNREKALPLAA